MEVVETNVQECKKDLDNIQMIIGGSKRVLDMITKRFLYTDKLKILIFDEADETLSIGFENNL